jgi:DNA-directed RNA polymerase specialized sigma24 family protein
VFGSLFVRLRLGQFDLGNDNDLINLLFRMAHNKLTAKQRRRRHEVGGAVDSQIHDPGPTPSRVLAPKDLLQAALRRLNAEEQRMLELRDQGAAWEAIATELGGTAEGRRKQWERARARVAAELELDGED